MSQPAPTPPPIPVGDWAKAPAPGSIVGAAPSFAAQLDATAPIPVDLGGIAPMRDEPDPAEHAVFGHAGLAEVRPAGFQQAAAQPPEEWLQTVQVPNSTHADGPSTAGVALVVAMAALAWQLVSHFARNQLPVLEGSGAPLTNFDRAVGALPLAGSGVGPLVGVVLAVAALAVLLVGLRRGDRNAPVQGAAAAISVLSLGLLVVLPAIAGVGIA